MGKVVLCFAGIWISSLACQASPAHPKKWVGEWSDHWTTIWLEADGSFESREIPEAQSKPGSTVYLKGTWSVDGRKLTLDANRQAFAGENVSTAFSVQIVPVRFQILLEMEPDGGALVTRRLHLTPSPAPKGITERLPHSHQEAAPDWGAIEKRERDLRSVVAKPVYRTLPPGADPRGKTW